MSYIFASPTVIKQLRDNDTRRIRAALAILRRVERSNVKLYRNIRKYGTKPNPGN